MFKWYQPLYKTQRGPSANEDDSENHSPLKEDRSEKFPPNIQMDKVFEEVDFTDEFGEVWDENFEDRHNMSRWQNKPLEVFLVPHSHQDPGWLLTFDEYFEAETRKGFNATTETLLLHPEARFIYAEVSFFSRWVNELTKEDKIKVAKLLHNGHLEIVSGGWVMPDEAVTSYYGIVDQMIEGHHWLWENFAYRPNISWSIDPFGQSTTMAYLVRKTGFTGMVIGRVHYKVKKYLAQREALEFHWGQSWDSENQPQIPCHLLAFSHYDVPHTCGPNPDVCCQFDFWHLLGPLCSGPPPNAIDPENVRERTELLVDQYRRKATLYNQRAILLVPLGDDFRYLSSAEWTVQLENYNKIIKYLDEHPKYRVKLRFATLSDYFRAFYRLHGYEPRSAAHSNLLPVRLRLSLLTGDFFTYADYNQHYWSGYFTSRPVEKFLSRVLEAELRASEILYTFARYALQRFSYSQLNSTVHLLDNGIKQARRALGIIQHHDAVTGTSRPHVVSDYNKRLTFGLETSRLISEITASVLLLNVQESSGHRPQNSMTLNQIVSFIREWNKTVDSLAVTSIEEAYSESSSPIPYRIMSESPNAPIWIIIFNPLSHSRTTTATFYVDSANDRYNVRFAPNVPVREYPQAIVQADLLESEMGLITRLRVGPIYLAALSLSQLIIEPFKAPSGQSVLASPKHSVPTGSFQDTQMIWLHSGFLQLGFDPRTGLLRYLIDTKLHLVLNVTIDFVTYHANGPSISGNGAYLFTAPYPEKIMELPTNPKIRVIRGPLVQEVSMYAPLVRHTVRLYKYPSNAIEIENIVNLNAVEPPNIELVMRIQSNVTNSDKVFFTDSNCFQFVRRQYHDKIPLQGNLYPMSCGVYIQSHLSAAYRKVSRLHLFSTYSHGVTSPSPGALYVWLDRRSENDDGRGLGHGLNGNWIAQSNFRLFVEMISPELIHKQKVTPSLTLTAHHALTDLIRPIQRFRAGSQIAPFMSRLVQLIPTGTMSKDYDLVSLKTFNHRAELFRPFSDDYGVQVGMLLHRLPIALTEPNSNKINIAKMFSRIGRRAAVRTTLNMVPEKPSNSTAGKRLLKVAVKPMELEAFLLTM